MSGSLCEPVGSTGYMREDRRVQPQELRLAQLQTPFAPGGPFSSWSPPSGGLSCQLRSAKRILLLVYFRYVLLIEFLLKSVSVVNCGNYVYISFFERAGAL